MHSSKSPLIIGVDSTIGAGLYNKFQESNIIPFATSRRPSICSAYNNIFYLDLLDVSSFASQVPLSLINVVFCCAGLTSDKRCTDNKDLSETINCLSYISIAQVLAIHNIRVVFLSTNLVFGGELKYPSILDSPTNPYNLYAAQKLTAEIQLRKILGNNLTTSVLLKLLILRILS